MDFLFLNAEYCLAFIALLVKATLQSHFPVLVSSSSLSLVMKGCLLICFLIFCLSWISLSSCLLDSVCTSPRLSSDCWISHLPCPVGYYSPEPDHLCAWLLFCFTCLPVFWPCLFLTMSVNKALQVDPYVSCLIRPVTLMCCFAG